MSAFVAGKCTDLRMASLPSEPLRLTLPGRGEGPSSRPLGHWQDMLAHLVPAEALALHAVAMSLGTTTTGAGASATTAITDPREMAWVFAGMTFAAFALYVAALRHFDWVSVLVQVAGGLVAAAAFVLWTMLQPTSAFAALALPFDLSPFLRVMIAIGGAMVLAAVAKLLALFADRHQATSQSGAQPGTQPGAQPGPGHAGPGPAAGPSASGLPQAA